MRKTLFLLPLILHLSAGLKAQYDPDKLQHLSLDHRIINRQDTTYSFYCIRSDKKIRARPGRCYYWFRKDTILSTTGAYDGRLLDGEFKICYPDKNLKEIGRFREGLKTGIWQTWFPGGKPETITHWKNGELQRTDSLYNNAHDTIVPAKG